MVTDGQFMEKWKPVHEKGMISYLKRDVITLFILLVLTGLFFYYKNPDRIDFIIGINVTNFIIFSIGRLLDWFSKENKYKRIKAYSEMSEPTC